nr:MAG TPA: hypothetical protein [Caudoviricetes sp.]
MITSFFYVGCLSNINPFCVGVNSVTLQKCKYTLKSVSIHHVGV